MGFIHQTLQYPVPVMCVQTLSLSSPADEILVSSMAQTWTKPNLVGGNLGSPQRSVTAEKEKEGSLIVDTANQGRKMVENESQTPPLSEMGILQELLETKGILEVICSARTDLLKDILTLIAPRIYKEHACT